VLADALLSIPAASIRRKALVDEDNKHPFAWCKVLDDKAKARGIDITGFVPNHGIFLKTAEGKNLRFYDVMPKVVPTGLVDQYNGADELLQWLDGDNNTGGCENNDAYVFDMCATTTLCGTPRG
jgi:hypothetical protein